MNISKVYESSSYRCWGMSAFRKLALGWIDSWMNWLLQIQLWLKHYQLITLPPPWRETPPPHSHPRQESDASNIIHTSRAGVCQLSPRTLSSSQAERWGEIKTCPTSQLSASPLVVRWERIRVMQTTQESWVRSSGQEDTLQREMATRSSILAWEIPWTEEPGRLQSIVGHEHDWILSRKHWKYHLHFKNSLQCG